MPDHGHESGNPYPEVDPQLVAEIEGALRAWTDTHHAKTPEEAQAKEFQTYYDALRELPLSLDVAKYEICCADGTKLGLWPRALTPVGKIYDLVSVDDENRVAMRPFIVVGSLVSLASLDDINDELRGRIASHCLSYAVSNRQTPEPVDAEGTLLVITPTFCEDAYLVMIPVYTTITDCVEELPIITEAGHSTGQVVLRVAAPNVTGSQEVFLIDSSAVFSDARLVAARATLTDGTVDDLSTYLTGTDE